MGRTGEAGREGACGFRAAVVKDDSAADVEVEACESVRGRSPWTCVMLAVAAEDVVGSGRVATEARDEWEPWRVRRGR